MTAILLSLVMAALVFKWFGFSINTMTLGGLAVAVGELIDDAIVEVESIFRRLIENRHVQSLKHPLLVVYEASTEFRNSIVFNTMIAVLVFIPLFALLGMEGQLFRSLGVAYSVSILASLLVSLTVTPALSCWRLGNVKLTDHDDDGFMLRRLKSLAAVVIRFSLRFPQPVLLGAIVAIILAFVELTRLDRDFLPPFNEESMQVNVLLPPGTSLAKSNEVAAKVEERRQSH